MGFIDTIKERLEIEIYRAEALSEILNNSKTDLEAHLYISNLLEEQRRCATEDRDLEIRTIELLCLELLEEIRRPTK